MFDDHTATQPRGRPSRFSDEILEEICRRLAGGESLRAICRGEAMPHLSTVLRWLPERPEFRDQYARAREQQAECFVDQIIDIADSVASCTDSAVVHAADCGSMPDGGPPRSCCRASTATASTSSRMASWS